MAKKGLPLRATPPRVGANAISRAIGGKQATPTQDVNVVSSVPVDVAIQDQTTPVVILPFHQRYARTAVAVDMVMDTYSLEVDDATGVAPGDLVLIFDPNISAFSHYYVVSVVNNSVELDSLIDYPFAVGAIVDFSKDNMNVSGVSAPQVFGLRGTEVTPVSASMDLTRIIVVAKTDGAVDLSKFGDITKLVRGLLMRHRNGSTYNVLNFKSNGELASKCYDWTPYSASNPAQGQNGFSARLTFSGQDKIGVAIRLNPGDDVEFIVQDDLTGLESYKIMAEGHIVD